ncbi:alpha/beta hydrolase [Corynebacterium alimapuense]|uniref:Esterase family protein n=1 Tax=Corynebacterium alimapuense TaxID=1576874 RepID=A0A3M8K8F3_9CORY|nr:alpha/beta hydrolase family protein [Corynebacterium alimapuense]RNE49501.1 esterase family protein [Corynebacterium alimapuense]
MKAQQLRTLMAASATVAISLGSISPAAAQSAEEGVNGVIAGSVEGSSQDLEWTGSTLEAALSSLNAIGSADISLSGPLVSSNSEYPLATRDIEKAEILDRRVIDAGERLERWTIASPAMQRDVSVQIMRAADSEAPAPMLYMLSGINTPYNAGWVEEGDLSSVFGDQDVTLVIPTEASASMFSDWVSKDSALGVHMWETFLVDEIAPLLEQEAELNFNGKRAVGGLSMGAIGAVHLANDNPEFFDATFGISGCYSTLDPIGRQMTSLIVGSRGGNVENLWGPFGSEEWVNHDVVNDPEGLRDMSVYLSAANGAVTAEDREFFGTDVVSMTGGSVLERGVLSCTESLDTAMTDLGMNHQEVHYKGNGTHNWNNYREELSPAWEHVKTALY